MSVPKLPPVSRTSPTKSLVKFDNVEPLTKNSFFEDGRFYALKNSQIQHQLPSPDKLRPYIDRKPGQMDTWPAHSTNMAVANVDSKPPPKPKFLQKLESYLDKELRVLGCKEASVPSDKRLQVFREVFEYLIDDFRTYKPILSSIKHEYENVINKQKEVIRGLEPLKAMLVNVNDQCEQKVLNMKQEEKTDVTNLKNENKKLQIIISSLKDEIAGLQQQVEKCQEEVGEEYRRYRDESDARKLLIQDINDLKYEQDEAKRALAAGEDESGKKEDAVLLRIALRKAREDLDLKTQRLAEVMADYGDVIPRREFEKLENQFKAMEDEYDAMKKDHEILMKEHSTLIDVHKKIIIQRDEFAMDCEKMRRSATPRPDWNKCATYIEGGSERWNELTNEKSSGDKMNVLLSELTGQDIGAIKSGGGVMVDYFEPKGSGDDIPLYLRSDERVRNRRLTKRDLCITIKDVWQEKIKKEGSAPFTKRSKMDEFLYEYLQKRFGVATMVTEWAYNIHDALTRYSFDKYVSMFAGILNEEIDEDQYYSQLSQLEDLYRMFAKADAQDTGFLKKDDFTRCIQLYFSSASDDDVMNIIKASEDELRGFGDDNVSYRDLFTEDDEGKSGPFISFIQDFSKQDRDKYLTEIENFLDSKSEISMDDLREAIENIDLKVSQILLDQYITLGFRGESKSSKVKLPKQTVMKNLHASCIKKT